MKTKNTVILLLIIIILFIVGVIFYSSRAPQASPNTATTTASTTTIPQPSPTSYLIPPPSNITYGGTYHNNVYGLTLDMPASYQALDTSASPTGVVASDSIQFVENGEKIFTINIFTKQQWNTIRTLENTEHLNVNNLGEGIYLGENETYIFSYSVLGNPTAVQSIISSIKYY